MAKKSLWTQNQSPTRGLFKKLFMLPLRVGGRLWLGGSAGVGQGPLATTIGPGQDNAHCGTGHEDNLHRMHFMVQC